MGASLGVLSLKHATVIMVWNQAARDAIGFTNEAGHTPKYTAFQTTLIDALKATNGCPNDPPNITWETCCQTHTATPQLPWQTNAVMGCQEHVAPASSGHAYQMNIYCTTPLLHQSSQPILKWRHALDMTGSTSHTLMVAA